MLESAIAAILELVREHGPLVLFLAAFVENAAFLSWAVPGEYLVGFGGYFVQQGQLRFELAWLATFAGVLAGDHVGYFVGRAGGRKLVRRLPFARVILRVEHLVARYGGLVVLFGRFSGGLRPAVLFTAGTLGLPYRRFWPFELLGAASWSALWLGLGVLGGTLLDYLPTLGPWGPWLFVGSALAAALAGWLLRGRLLRLLFDDGPETAQPAPAVPDAGDGRR